MSAQPIVSPFRSYRGMRTLAEKRRRSLKRAHLKQIAARRIPHQGLIVSTREVKTQRYLREHGFPHSTTVADVLLPRDRFRSEPQAEVFSSFTPTHSA